MSLVRRLPGLIYVHRYTVYSAFILLLTLIYFLFKWNLVCTNIQAWQHVNKMCYLYEQGNAVGSLCQPLCKSKDITSLTCHTFKATKEAVFSAELHNTRLVIKSASADVQSLHWYDNGVLKYPSNIEFLNTINAIVKNKLNLSLPHEMAVRLTQLKPGYKEESQTLRMKEMENLWVLLQDNEYLLSVIYTERDVFPQLLGTCGPYFAVEYMEPVQDTSSVLATDVNRENWGRRLRTAILIVELLDELEGGFKEPFHLCDIKLEHFGMVKGVNKMKYVDLNNVYPTSMMKTMLKDIESCTEDEDCEFLDCRSYCNKAMGKCANYISNNNLQVVCEKIFLGWRMSNRVLVPGLLMSEHTPSELASILRQCANPDGHAGKPRGAPDDEVKKRLYNTLVEMEQSVNNDFLV